MTLESRAAGSGPGADGPGEGAAAPVARATGEEADGSGPGAAANEAASAGAEAGAPVVLAPLPTLLAAALVVLASAAVLVLEVVSVRLVAPYVGLTLETYTAAIGVALAAISVGSWLGGQAADRSDPRSLLGLLVAAGGALLFATRPLVLAVGPAVGHGPAAVVTLMVVAVAAPIVVLSAVPPMVVKLQLTGLRSAGTTVGRLSALGTAGALAGTFLTGFVLLSALPTSRVLLAVGTVLVAVGLAVLLRLRRRGEARSITLSNVTLILVGSLAAAAALVGSRGLCEYESAYFCARVQADPSRPTGRTLYLDNLRHSYVDLADPTHLEFAYTQRIGDVLAAMAPAGAPLTALHVGGGGFSVPRHLAATRPGSRSLVLELDPVVLRVARERLGLRTGSDLEVRIGDGRLGVAEAPEASYDVVVGDAFGSLTVPWHLATRDFAAEIRRVLRPGGVYVLNVIDFPPLGFARAEAATLQAVFPHVAMLGTAAQLAGTGGGNFILVASAEPLPYVQRLRALAAARGEAGGVASGEAVAGFARGGRLLTDDDAPVDQLITPYPRLPRG